MNCPECQHQDSKVIDSRSSGPIGTTRRRRVCLKCGHRFTTYEHLSASVSASNAPAKPPATRFVELIVPVLEFLEFHNPGILARAKVPTYAQIKEQVDSPRPEIPIPVGAESLAV